jgi:NADH dehydrogenase (ubiquinone) 1 alpha/beta subcomplex 1, acyl-carrier protein
MFMNLNNLQNRSKRVTLLHSKRQFASGFLQRQEVSERVKQVVKNFAKVDQGKVSDQAKFAQDLGLDSLDTVEVVMAIEEEFAIEIPDVEADKIVSIDLAVDYIASVPEAK